MYLFENLKRHLIKNNVEFSVKYKAGEEESVLNCIKIDVKEEITITPLLFDYENNYVLMVNGREEKVQNLESLLVRLQNLKVIPENAYF